MSGARKLIVLPVPNPMTLAPWPYDIGSASIIPDDVVETPRHAVTTTYETAVLVERFDGRVIFEADEEGGVALHVRLENGLQLSLLIDEEGELRIGRTVDNTGASQPAAGATR